MHTSNSPFSLAGKTILVTGASAGIGKAIAIACAKMGATLLLNGRSESRLQETLGSLPPGEHCIFAVDLSDCEGVQKMADNLPPVDGVVHCAGIGHRKVCKFLDESDIDKVLNTNFKATVLLQTKLQQKRKLKKGASVVFIASRAAESPSVGNAIYSASKGALLAYARCLMLELAPQKIRVNSICPAMVWTELITQEGPGREVLEEAEHRYPLKRFGQPEDVAYLAVYMLSDAASWMTGSAVDITGGGE